MHTRRSFLRIAALGAIAVIAAGGAVPAVGDVAAAQIYQQRAADGSIVLTDRPSASALTERTWQLQHEDPVAAQQRARDVRNEAQIVSERIARQLEAQQRRATDDDRMRMRVARLDNDDESYDDDLIIGAPLLRPFARRHHSGVGPHRPPSHRQVPRAATMPRASQRGPAAFEMR